MNTNVPSPMAAQSEPPVGLPDPADEQRASLLGVFGVLRRRWVVMLPMAAAVFAITYAASALSPRLYTATATISINPAREQVISSDQLVTRASSDSAQIESEVQVLRSMPIMRRVVETLRLEESQDWNSALRPTDGIRAALAPLARVFGQEAPRSAGAAVEGEREGLRESIARSLTSAVSIDRRANSYIVSVSARSRSPEIAQQIANAVVQSYLEAQAEAQLATTERANDWLNRRVAVLSEELQAKERAAEVFRRSAGLGQAAGGGEQPQSPEVQTMLVTARADLTEKEARLRQVQTLLRQGGSADLIAGAANSALIVELRSRESELTQQQGELEQRYGPRHPSVQSGLVELNNVHGRIEAEIGRITTSLSNEVEVARNRLYSLQGNFGSVSGSLSGNEEDVVRYRQLLREAEAARTVHQSYLQRFQEVDSQRSLAVTAATVVSNATAPSAASSPNMGAAFRQAVLFALICGVGLGFLLEFLDSTVSTTEEVERKIGVSAIAAIPYLTPKDYRGLASDQRHPGAYLVEKPMSAFAEAFRVLRTTVLHGRLDHPIQVLAITSALPDEGKTTVSLCMARIAALSGQRAIVVDCDLRRKSLSQVVGLKPEKGLLDVLTGSVNWSDAVIRDHDTTAQILACTPKEFTPVDVFSSRAMAQLVADLRGSFDLVILDCAPVLAVADARLAAAHSDAALVVVRSQKTPATAGRSALRELRKAGIITHGVVLNRMTPANRSSADSLYYGYAQKSYYTN